MNLTHMALETNIAHIGNLYLMDPNNVFRHPSPKIFVISLLNTYNSGCLGIIID